LSTYKLLPEISLIFKARHPIMEKFGPYCFIGAPPPNFKLPLPIERIPEIGPLKLNQDRFQFWRNFTKKSY
jgi:hypothetical protein